MKRMWAITVVLGLVLTACASDEAGTTTTVGSSATSAGSPATTQAPPTTQTPATTQAPATTEAPASGMTLAVASSELGDILVDGDGNTLYVFIPDDQGDSTCYDSCASNWPPLPGGVTAGDGVDPASIGVTTRTGGSEQTTYNGWPLYYFAADGAPGDTNGQGVGDIWFVVSPEGEPIN